MKETHWEHNLFTVPYVTQWNSETTKIETVSWFNCLMRKRESYMFMWHEKLCQRSISAFRESFARELKKWKWRETEEDMKSSGNVENEKGTHGSGGTSRSEKQWQRDFHSPSYFKQKVIIVSFSSSFPPPLAEGKMYRTLVVLLTHTTRRVEQKHINHPSQLKLRHFPSFTPSRHAFTFDWTKIGKKLTSIHKNGTRNRSSEFFSEK